MNSDLHDVLITLLHRLSDDGKVESEQERDLLVKFANVFNQQTPKHACPDCHFKRVLKEAAYIAHELQGMANHGTKTASPSFIHARQ